MHEYSGKQKVTETPGGLHVNFRHNFTIRHSSPNHRSFFMSSGEVSGL